MGQSQASETSSADLAGQGYKPMRKPQICPISSEMSFFQRGQEMLSCSRYPIESHSSDSLVEHNRYYTQRICLSHPHLLSLYFSDFIEVETGANIKKQFTKINTTNNWSNKKTNVNNICSLNIFDQYCKGSLGGELKSPRIKLHLYHQYERHTLEGEIETRKRRDERFREKEIWELVGQAVSAGRALLHSHLKEPLLSPNSIKIDSRGNYKVGEWEFTHFYEEQEEQETYFYEQGETFLKPQGQGAKSKIKHNHPFNILTCYYWAPEGTSAMQSIIALGSIGQNTATGKKIINNQIFSLGMTILHMCLMRPLYQKETLSEKKINSYIKQAVSLRCVEGYEMSGDLIRLLGQMLAWDPEERITYDELYNQIMPTRSSHTAFSIFTTENDEAIESGTFRSKKLSIFKNEKGSGSVIQGSGDLQHPLDQSRKINLPNTLRNQVVNYQKIDFTIKRERKEWQKLQNRIQESSYKVQPNSSQLYKKQLFTNVNFSSPSATLAQDGQDCPNNESLCSYNPNKLAQVQNTDHQHEPLCDTISKSLQNSIKLHDISQIKNGEETEQISKQKASTIKFEVGGEEHLNYSTSFSYMKKKSQANMFDSLVLKSSVIPMKMNQSQSEEDLFTPPQLLALIRSSFSGPSNKTHRASNHQNNQKSKIIESKKIEAELCSSVYVKEQFAKGFYEGGKVDGLRSGYGTFYYVEGGKYCGDWQNNQMHGKGTLYYADGRIAYQGDWIRDSLSGKGILYNENPKRLIKPYDYSSFDQSQDYWVYYEGSFHSDDKWGKGTLLLSNGQRYQGGFRNDVVQGRGIFYTLQGMRIIGQWSANRLIRVIKQQKLQQNSNQN